ncbi:MAG: glycosyltransferase family 39 protein [Thermodesulfovibrionales bacterium]|nr:glycosyltransferase family 39 protein [Thermodesulfovibrionales bacterium]
MDILNIDKKLFALINAGVSNSPLDILMPALTSKGYFLLLPYMIYLVWTGFKGQKNNSPFDLTAAIWAIVISFGSFLITDWLVYEIKHLIMRVRPCDELEGVRLLVGCSKSYSMPSNHASNAFAVALPLFYLARQSTLSLMWRLYPFILAILVAFSRVYVGVHYPSDIIFGAMVGCAFSAALIFWYKRSLSRYKATPHKTIFGAALIVISLFRIYYILHGPMDLSADEAHYWEWSRRPDWSYYSKGPMIAYLIYIGTAVFGDNIFGIRIMAVLFSALSSIFIFKLAKSLYKDDRLALYSALLFQIIPLFAPFGVIFTIDSPFIFFWIISLYYFWESVKNNEKNYSKWLLAGVFIGLGLLTKYTMAFFLLSVFLFLFFSGKRYLLKTTLPYLTSMVSLLIFTPVIIWNFRHDWVTIKHTAGQAHVSEGLQLSLKSFFEFFGSQIGVITPVLFIMILYALFKTEALGQRTKEFFQSRFLIYFSVPVIAFFLLKSLHGKVQANWAMTGYITGIIAFARYFMASHAITPKPSIIRYPMLITGIAMALIVTSIAHYPSLINLSSKLDPSEKLRGWKELGKEVSVLYDSLSEKGHVLIFSDKYQVSSELAFYVKGHPRTYCINLSRRMNQYDLWPDMNSDAEIIKQRLKDNRVKINGIFVRAGNAEMPPEVAKSFEGFEKKLLQVCNNEQLLKEYSLFICYNFRGFKTIKPEKY